MAAEARAGQADGKPEVEHEDDEHFRTEDSSCRVGGGEHQNCFTPRPRTELRSMQALSAREGGRLMRLKLYFVAILALQQGEERMN